MEKTAKGRRKAEASGMSEICLIIINYFVHLVPSVGWRSFHALKVFQPCARKALAAKTHDTPRERECFAFTWKTIKIPSTNNGAGEGGEGKRKAPRRVNNKG